MTTTPNDTLHSKKPHQSTGASHQHSSRNNQVQKNNLPSQGHSSGVHTEPVDFFQKYATPIVALAVCLIVGTAGYFTYDFIREKNESEALNSLYEFEKGTWKNFQEKKITTEQMIQEWNKLTQDVTTNKKIAFFAIQVIQPLMAEKKWDQATNILLPLTEKYEKDPYVYYFLSNSLSGVYEDAGKLDEAIALIENILKQNIKLMEAKTYFDLGRLYNKRGQVDKAKTNFQYVIDNYPDDKMGHMARVYLQKIMNK